MVIGPYEQIPMANGQTADLYLLRYDGDGRLLSPRTDAMLRQALPDATDVYLFSHGWNNVFDVALKRYRSFIHGFIQQRAEFKLPTPQNYKPILVGVIWPSTSFVLPSEAGPKIAAPPDADGDEARQSEEMLTFVTESLGADEQAQLAELVDGRTQLGADEARQAAALVLGALGDATDDESGAEPPDVDSLLAAWQAMDQAQGATPATAPVDDDDFGTVDSGGTTAGPQAAGFSLDPRNLLRAATMWKMKSRAGTVGAKGVSQLVRAVLDNDDTRLHLVGHSYGARVVLSALATGGAPPNKAHSVLLLQPAINRWCFAPDVAGRGFKGGFNPVLDRVRQPVVTTFSSHDSPLTKFFHLAAVGKKHLGEPDVAAVGNTELYGALGGFGPAGLGNLAATQKALPPGNERYALNGGRRVIAVNGGVSLDGKPAISNHGDISNPVTWWAMHCLTAP